MNSAPVVRDALASMPRDRSVAGIVPSAVPHHVGLVLDGNRRWAREKNLQDVSDGHRIGFGKIPEVLSWCDAAGIRIVTLWMLSTDNIKNRAQAELDALYEIDEDVTRKLVAGQRFRLSFLGNPAVLPARLVAVLRDAEAQTRHIEGMRVNLGIAYGGREEILQAVRSLVAEALSTGDTHVTEEQLAAHLLTAGQPDPDLVIRTSGESRTSGFLLWQAALSELFFCDCYWPDFSERDLHRALQSFSARDRRFGG